MNCWKVRIARWKLARRRRDDYGLGPCPQSPAGRPHDWFVDRKIGVAGELDIKCRRCGLPSGYIVGVFVEDRSVIG